jgi:hypothetical protein
VLTANLAIGNASPVAPGSSTGGGNSWDLGGSWPVRSTDLAVVTGPRAADGTIAPSDFLVPSNGSTIGARLEF